MAHAVTLVMIDIVKSRTIHRRLWADVGDLADRQYTDRIYAPFRRRIDDLLTTHGGRLHDAVGDQVAAYFDHTQPAVRFAVDLQRAMAADPISVPDGCDCPHLQLHVAVGRGTMEDVNHQQPGAARVGAFNELARVLAVAANDQVLVTDEVIRNAGKVPDVAWHEWDVVLPKEEDRVTVRELLWDGREPRRPKDMAAVGEQAVRLAEERNTLAQRVDSLEGENRELKASLTAALERVQARADATGDPRARAAIEAARTSGDLAQLDAALDAEHARREAEIREQARDWLDLCRESADVAYVRGDIDKAQSRLDMVLRFFPDDLNAINRVGHIQKLRGRLNEAEASYRRVLDMAGSDEVWRARAYGNLGAVQYLRGDWDGAEAMYRRALAIDEPLGRREAMAKQYGNIGIVRFRRGDLAGAVVMCRRALAIYEQLGELDGVARAYGNLGAVLHARRDLNGAEAAFRRSLATNEELGRVEGIATQYGNLGGVQESRGDADRARELWTKSRNLFAKLGAEHMVARLQGWIDGPPP